MISKSILFVFLVCVTAGCTTIEPRLVNPQVSKLGVLIIAGENLNSCCYKDAWSSSFVFETSAKVAAALQQEIQQRGTTAQVFLSRDRNINPRTHISELLSQDKRDGLIQVSIIHKKQEDKFSITLSLRYNPLKWGEQNIITLQGPTANYSLVNDASFNDVRLREYARDFSTRLYKEGFIGK